MATDILVKVGADISDFSKKMNQTTKSMRDFMKNNEGMFKSIGKTGNLLTKSITAPAIAATTALTGVTLVKGFGRLMGIDTAQAKLKALGHDAESVTDIMDSALQSVKGTAFGMDEAATTAANAVAAGVSVGEELTRYLTLAGDAAAVAGADLSEMGSILNKVQTSNKAYNSELQQLSDRGLPIYQWLAQEAGVTSDAIFDMASNGEISSEMLLNAIENNIGGAAKIMGEESFAAGLANIWADISRIGANFLNAEGDGKGFFDTLKPLITEFREYLSTLEDKAAEMGAKFGQAFSDMIQRLRELKAWYDGLSPIFQTLIKNAIAFGAVAAVLAGPFLKLIAMIPSIVAGFTTFMTVIKTVIPIVKAVGAAITGISLPVALTVAAIIALAALIYLYWDEIKEYTIIAWNAIADFFTELWASIVDTAISIWQGLSDFFTNLWNTVKDAFSTAWQAISSAVMTVIQPLINNVMNVFNGVKDGIITVWDGLKTYFTAVWDLIKNIFLGAILLIVNIVTGNFDEAKANAIAIWNNVKDAIGRIWEGIKTMFSGALSAIVGFVKAGFENARNAAKSVNEAIKSVIKSVWDAIKRFFTETLVNIVDTVRTKFTDTVSAVKEKMAEVFRSISDVWTRAIDFIRNIDLRQVGADIIQGLINGIKSKIEGVVNVVKSIGDSISGTIKGILKIASPSKLMYEYGQFTGEGMALGIGSMVGKVKQSATTMASAVIDSEKKKQSELSALNRRADDASFYELGDVLETTSEILSELENITEERLGNLGDIWNVRMEFIRTNSKNTLANMRSDFNTMGAQVIQGMINGLESMRGKVLTSVTSIANAMKQAMANALGIASPSRVFKTFGEQVGEGFVIGIDSMRSEVVRATERLADASTVNGYKTPTTSVNISDMTDRNADAGSNKGGFNPTINNYFTPAESTPSESARKQKQAWRQAAMEMGY